LDRIREIRTSERRYYQKITDIYAECSSDYDPKSEVTNTKSSGEYRIRRFSLTLTGLLRNWIRYEKDHRSDRFV
jgi:hypothetical protein